MFDYFFKGGPVMWPLLACSMMALTIMIERILFWVREDLRRDQSLVDRVLELCRQGDWPAVKQAVSGSRDYVIRILVTGILHREFSMSKAMETAAADEVKRMQRYLTGLDTMITVAPLLGILGTVAGMVVSFEHLGVQAMQNPHQVTTGIAQALITTVAGLVIAIPSAFCYNYFSSRTENALLSIEKYTTSLEVVYEKWSMTVSKT